MPSAAAPSMSSSTESPTIAASTGATPMSSSAATEDRLVRLVHPWARDAIAQSTSSRVVGDEVRDLAAPVRDQAELQARARAAAEHRQDVVVEVEVLRALPGQGHLDREVAGRVGVAAHAANDPLREGEPELLVVTKLRMALRVATAAARASSYCAGSRLEPVPLAELAVSLRPEVRPRLRQREIDVEEHRAQGHLPRFTWCRRRLRSGTRPARAPGSEGSPASSPRSSREGRRGPGGTRRVGLPHAHSGHRAQPAPRSWPASGPEPRAATRACGRRRRSRARQSRAEARRARARRSPRQVCSARLRPRAPRPRPEWTVAAETARRNDVRSDVHLANLGLAPERTLKGS